MHTSILFLWFEKSVTCGCRRRPGGEGRNYEVTREKGEDVIRRGAGEEKRGFWSGTVERIQKLSFSFDCVCIAECCAEETKVTGIQAKPGMWLLI
jgi:hypothetical protein